MNILQNRKKIYDPLRKDGIIYNDKDIFFNIKIKDTLFKNLQIAYTNYIYKTLLSYYGKKIFLADWRFKECDYSFLTLYRKEILSLPNINKNGVIFPKKDNMEEFNELQSIVIDIMISSGLINHISRCQMITPRIIFGGYEDRTMPLATGKYHSDAWAGQNADATTSIVVGGDSSITVEFCKPIGIKSEFFSIIDNYDLGFQRNYFESLDFLSFAETGSFNVFDHSCVHRTLRKNSVGCRISVDFCFSMKKGDSENKNEDKENRNQFLKKDDFVRLGKSLKIKVNQSIREAEKYDTSKNKNKAKIYFYDELNKQELRR